jgi:hypothetical protein
MPPDEAPMALYHRKKLKMKFTLLVLACLAVPSIIVGAIHGANPPPTAPPPDHLTIAQTAAAKYAAHRLEAQIEAANIARILRAHSTEHCAMSEARRASAMSYRVRR